MQEEKPLVSVCVVTYNNAPYIKQTLDSILSQTYKKIELIISDDYSTDDTVLISKSWIDINRDRFVKVHLLTANKNYGVTLNCNKAQKLASGEWIKGLGGDDLLRADCIELFVDYVKTNPNVDIIQCKLIKVNRNNDIIGYNLKGPHPIFHSDTITAYWQHKILLYKDPVDALALFKRKSMLEKVNYYDVDFPMQEDTAFSLKVTDYGYKIFLLDDYLVKRRMISGSLSGLSDNKIISKNEIIRISVNNKYVKYNLPKLDQYFLSLYNVYIMLIYKTKIINRRTLLCKLLVNFLLSPYLILKRIRLGLLFRTITSINNQI